MEPTVTTTLADYDRLRESNLLLSKHNDRLERLVYKFLGVDPKAPDASHKLFAALEAQVPT